MKDRFMNGLVAGTIGGTVSLITDLFIIDILHFGTLRFSDFASILILGNKPQSFWEYAFGLIGHIGFAAVQGVIFAYLIVAISHKYIIVKGIVFGLSVWFLSYIITFLFKVSQLTNISLNSAIADYFSSAVFGAILGYSFYKLEGRNIINMK